MRDEEPTYCDQIPDHRVRLASEVGEAFALGLAGSSAFNLIRGLRGGGGLAGAARAVSASAPRAAGSLAAYFAVFSALDSALSLARRKEDHWNGLAAGAASWAALGVRRGAAGAAFFGLSWGLEIMADRIFDWLADPEATPPQPQRIRPKPPPGCFWAIPHGPRHRGEGGLRDSARPPRPSGSGF